MSAIQTTLPPTSTPWIKTIAARITWEHVLFAGIVLLTIITRFTDLGLRTMSHDETQHTYFSWLFYKGNGYTHTPLTHGPLQFHLIALSFALFGDTDFAARIPHALASVLAVLYLWNFRRYLGRTGTLVTAALMLISPFMLYYGRYARNEAFVVLFGLMTIWAILRYLESGQNRYLIYMTAATALHFAAKETAFIYSAQALLFLSVVLIQRVTNRPWRRPVFYRPFLLAVIAGFLLIGTGFVVAVINTATPEGQASLFPSFLVMFPEILGLLSLGLAIFFVTRGLGMTEIRRERAFNLVMLIGLLVLPHLSPIPVKYLGWNPLDYSSQGMLHTGIVLVPIVLLTIGLGVWWNWRLFLVNMAVFYSIFTVFYTTLFTYGAGFFTGLVGSLGYWLEQQGVQRGSQPWYYYLLIQVPVYEYLPVIGTFLAGGIVLIRSIKTRFRQPQALDAEGQAVPKLADDIQPGLESDGSAHPNETTQLPETYPQEAPFLPMMGFWAITSLAAYTIAGEKMPWLTVHITLPFILLAGWGIGQLIDRIDWKLFLKQKGLLVLVLLYLFTRSLNSAFEMTGQLFSGGLILPPDWPGFIAYVLFALLAGGLLLYLLRTWSPSQFGKLVTLGFFGVMAFLTARTAYQAAFIHYDQATELLVYAHAAPANKMTTDQIAEISNRINQDLSLGVAYDNSDGADDPASAWPLTWYLRNFTNTRSYGKEIPRELVQYPIIYASDRNWEKVEPLLRDAYDSFQYVRMWWPIQDYFNLTWERISQALTDPQMRRALIDIWLNRDYRAYARVTNQDLSLPNWQPSRSFRMYVRKDVSSQIWQRGSQIVQIDLPEDPYVDGQIDLQASQINGSQGTEPGQFQSQRGLAAAADGTLSIADTLNHRIQHISQDGDVIGTWGTYSGSETSLSGQSPPGTFNEPWDVAVGPDGMVYVADTWNNRIQKFTADGEYITSWGYFGQAEAPDAFWGPRAVAVDGQGRVFVSDTGNKRVVVFDSEGFPLSVIDVGLNEPVGIAAGPDGRVYIADTWNQQIVVVNEVAANIFTPEFSWAIDGWYSQSLDNKPYLAVDENNRVFITDPDGYRVIEFTGSGEFVHTWGVFGSDANAFQLPSGITVAGNGLVWVSDTGGHRVMLFQVP